MHTKLNKKVKAWVVTVDMGYGHQRAAYPLKSIAYSGIINANTYKGIPKKDKETWQSQRSFYEAVSRFKRVPLVGDATFKIFDYFQSIPKFYPKRDLSRPSLQVWGADHMIMKGFGKHLIEKISKKKLPLITPFFITAMMAEIHDFPGDIYCIICDADISRAWVPLHPKTSRIKYFAPNQRVVERLQEYGVTKNRIILTGFPLPEENLGYPTFKTLKDDFKHRLLNLDPNHVHINKYKHTLLAALEIKNFPAKSNHPLTLTFAVGGAGAQRELGADILENLAPSILNHKIKINLIAGVHKDVNTYFKKAVVKFKLNKELGNYVNILFEKTKADYFKKFNLLLRKTDILWTKPSELSFYTALGLPIVIAEPIGSQEHFNQQWLVYLGGGINQEKTKYTTEWIFDWIKSGRLAEAAAQGFLEAPKNGYYNIQKYLATGKQEDLINSIMV